jgi:hypothetical protein
LAKLKGIYAKNIAIQLLSTAEQLGPNDICLFAQNRDITKKENTPNWPPYELVYRAGTSPRLGGLKSKFLTDGPALQHGITDVSNLILGKFYQKSLVWRLLTNNAQQTTQRRGGRKKKGRGGAGNLKSRYQLQDGDLLGFVDALTLGAQTVDTIYWDREADRLGQQHKKMAEFNKRQIKHKGNSLHTKVVKRAAPVGDAKIHVYLGFSSSDDDEEAEN